MEEKLCSFFSYFFDSFSDDLHSDSVDNLQQEIAESLFTYMGMLKDGEPYVLNSDKSFMRVSEEEIASDYFFDSREIFDILKY